MLARLDVRPVLVGILLGTLLSGSIWVGGRPARVAPELVSVGPRLVSNQTSYPVTIQGRGLVPGLQLVIEGGPEQRRLSTAFVDDRHLTARIPPLVLDPQVSLAELRVRLEGPGGEKIAGTAPLLVANDAAFSVPLALALSPDGGRVAVAVPAVDELWVVDRNGSGLERVRVCDGPRSVASWSDPSGRPYWLVACELDGELRLVPLGPPDAAHVRIALGRGLQDVAVGEPRTLAYVTDHVRDVVRMVDLVAGRQVRELRVGVNPRAVAVAEGGARLVVANFLSEDVSMVDAGTGAERRLVPGPGTPIVGGHTEPYSSFVMGGKAIRSLVASERLHVAFGSSIGPNIGPNPERMEVSMNGGISVIAAGGRFLRHVSIGRGLPEGLALDDEQGLLYAADVATGRVVILDAARLAASDDEARTAVLGELELPPGDAPRVLPASELGVNSRASESLHAGPWALALADGGTRLLVLCRFSGVVHELDVTGAREGRLFVAATHALPSLGPQRNRRAGELLYFTDVGNSRMTCDACHPGGHAGGMLYEKTTPIRIYRSSTLRGIRETPPYFTPSMLPSLRHMARDVLGRNRFHSPDPGREELARLAAYCEALAPLPNPFRGMSGELRSGLVLPDGRHGDARRGLALFEGKGGCASASCHPAPQFTADQAVSTRGLLQHVGTPLTLPLRLEHQDLVDPGWPPPSLIGAWDLFPLLASGAGGLTVADDGTLRATHPFALRRVLELPGREAHGGMAALTERERDDLLAYLMSL